MFRVKVSSAFVWSMCILMLILAAPAYAEEDGYYESNEDGSTHTHYYYSDYSDEEYSFTEYCTWEDSYYDYLNYGQDGHYHYYTCPYY